MLDYLIGLLLFGLGIRSYPPNILGEQTTQISSVSGTPKPFAQLKLMRPKFTAAEQEAFQKERAKRDANLKKIGETRIQELQKTFTDKKKSREEKDQATRDVLEAKAKEFTDSQKRQKLLALSDKYQSVVSNQLKTMQQKLESMSTLLDRISAATGALKTQGVDVAAVESEISSAQAKVNNALALVGSLAESLPTAFSIGSEETAKKDVTEALQSIKTQLAPVRESFQDAHEGVDLALSHLESLTDAVQVGLWPERK
jgi:hypothetical protein